LNKNSDYDKNYNLVYKDFEALNNKNKEHIKILESLQNQKNELQRKLNNLKFDHNNSNDLVIKLLKTKLNGLRTEINSIKSFYINEIKNIKKEHSKNIELLYEKIKNFSTNFENDKSLVVNFTRNSMEKELFNKLTEKEKEAQTDLLKTKQKYDNALIEQNRLLEEKIKENKNLVKLISN